MNFRWMEVYLSVIDTGSFAGAARQQYMTQPAVSMAISSLERELNQTLISRRSGQKGGIQLTREGKIFAEYARRTLEEYWKLKDSFTITQDAKPLLIGSSPTPMSSVLPSLLLSFRESRPQCPLQVKVFRGRELRKLLLDGDIECAITGIDAMLQNEEFREDIFFVDPMVLVCDASFHDSSPITVNQLKKFPLIIRNTDCNTTEMLIRQLAKFRLTLDDMNVLLQVFGNSDVLNEVRKGYAGGFVVRSSLDGREDSERFRIVPVKGLKLSRDIRLVYLKDREQSPVMKSFLQYARGTEWRRGRFSYNTMPGTGTGA